VGVFARLEARLRVFLREKIPASDEIVGRIVDDGRPLETCLSSSVICGLQIIISLLYLHQSSYSNTDIIMNAHKDGWFTEIGAPKGSNVALSILSRKTLHEEQSEYQHIIVFERLVGFHNSANQFTSRSRILRSGA
jgi:hypothetical protein